MTLKHCCCFVEHKAEDCPELASEVASEHATSLMVVLGQTIQEALKLIQCAGRPCCHRRPRTTPLLSLAIWVSASSFMDTYVCFLPVSKRQNTRSFGSYSRSAQDLHAQNCQSYFYALLLMLLCIKLGV